MFPQKTIWTLVFWALMLALFAVGCGNDDDITPQEGCPTGQEAANTLLGNPSGATAAASNAQNYLIQLPEYTLAYHKDRGTPTWVSWHLQKRWIDTADRQDDFRAYTDLPTGWYQVSSSSYTGSGFDRGHLCPSGDRTCSAASNSATFFMINMVPQAPSHNRGVWNALEGFSRNLLDLGNEVYIIAGSYGNGGTGSNNSALSIDNGRIAVPSSLWKVLVILPEGDNDLARITADTRIIAVDIPNRNSVSGTKWHDYIVTVNDLEARTGLDLLDKLPNGVEAALQEKVDTGPW